MEDCTRKKEYLLWERPVRALWIFAFPMIVGNLFQQFYTMADSMIVGRYVSEDALAAIGASSSLTTVFICIAIGGGVGSSVLTSRYFGARAYQRMRLSISTSLLSFLAVSLLLAFLGLGFGRSLLILLNTPENILDMAVTYLDIYFMGLPFLFMYNILSSMFNALGRSRIPLYLLIFSSVLNIGLDLYFVCSLNLGIAGAAWATLIAQGLSVLLSLLLFLKELRSYPAESSAEPEKTFYSPKELLAMCRVALPSIFQQSTVSVGMMLVQSVVNGFGSQVLAGYSAATRVENLCFVPMAALGNAMSSYTAQNLGADKEAADTRPGGAGKDFSDTRPGGADRDSALLPSSRGAKRVREGYHAALRLVALFAVLLCILLELFHRPLIASFLGSRGNQSALETGSEYLRFIGFFFGLIGLKMCTDGLLRGAAHMKMFTIANLTNLTIRVAFASLLAPRFGVAFVWYAIPLGWLANFLISWSEYRSGKWKTTAP